MPILRSTACTSKLLAISGSAVAITVPSRNSMKKAPATNSAAGESPPDALPVIFSAIFPLPHKKYF
jgi:hypothetical protein